MGLHTWNLNGMSWIPPGAPTEERTTREWGMGSYGRGQENERQL